MTKEETLIKKCEKYLNVSELFAIVNLTLKEKQFLLTLLEILP
jgi:hypothetical protein